MAARKAKVYVVHTDGKPTNLVRAFSQAQALAHVTEPKFEAVIADADHLTSEWARAMPVEDATAQPDSMVDGATPAA